MPAVNYGHKNIKMRIKISLFFLLSYFIFTSCHNQETVKQKAVVNDSLPQTLPNHDPSYNYVVNVPEGWVIRDTIMQSFTKIRMLVSPKSLQTDFPAGNILIAWMNGQKMDEFTNKNINYLKANMPGIVILEKGNIDSTEFSGQWFTYTKEQGGKVREMINYIIPVKGFAYMITCGCNEGSFKKYRAEFDKIAQSFKVN